jgi:hypothetical protein
VTAGGAELDWVDGVDTIEAARLDLLTQLNEELPLPNVWPDVPFEQRVTNPPRITDEDMLERVGITRRHQIDEIALDVN